ncbi:MAG TPA: hypothetical protein GXZ90_08515 [Clostridiales bacterium]|nr:hypothetical protein [Clostridiales bacterium]
MYDVHINGDLVATSLSRGELNQWLLDVDKEINNINIKTQFRRGFNFVSQNQDDFLSFIYGLINIELKFNFGTNFIEILRNEFY